MYGATLIPTKPKIKLLIKNNTKKREETTLKFTFPALSFGLIPNEPIKVVANVNPLPSESRRQKASPEFAA